jgi:hypothetical protein
VSSFNMQFREKFIKFIFKCLNCKMRNRSIKTPWLESANELYRPSDRNLSAKLVTTFADLPNFSSRTRPSASNRYEYLKQENRVSGK